jgi:hypothetical protein
MKYFHKILSKVGDGYSIVRVEVAGVFLVSSNVIQSEARMQYLVSSYHSLPGMLLHRYKNTYLAIPSL